MLMRHSRKKKKRSEGFLGGLSSLVVNCVTCVFGFAFLMDGIVRCLRGLKNVRDGELV